MASRQELLDYFEASEQTYRFLSQMLFKELNDEAINELADAPWPTDTGNEHLDRGYELIRRYFKFSEGNRVEQLAVEYARIFLAAGVYTRDARTAIPYESVFTGEERSMMGEARDDVVRRFLADGFKVNPDLHEPEDHVAFELEYLSDMNGKAFALLSGNDRVGLSANVRHQLEFVRLHLLNWLPELLEVAQEYAKLTFYTGMLHVAIGALEQSEAMLSSVDDYLANGGREKQ